MVPISVTLNQRHWKQIESGGARITVPLHFSAVPPVEGALHIPWVGTKTRSHSSLQCISRLFRHQQCGKSRL